MRYEAKFTPTVEDAVTGYRMLNRQGNDFLKLGVFGGITAIVIFGIAACIFHAIPLGISGIFIGVFIPGVLWLIEWNFRRRVKKIKPEEQKFFFTEDGFEFSNSFTQSKETWDKITKASLDERGMLFYIDSQNFSFFIPSRAFVGGYFPLHELKSLLASKKIRDLITMLP
jgi:YcxB-like protein